MKQFDDKTLNEDLGDCNLGIETFVTMIPSGTGPPFNLIKWSICYDTKSALTVVQYNVVQCHEFEVRSRYV